MHRSFRWPLWLAAGLFLPATLMAQAPAGATAKCKDGSYSTATSAHGRCSGHGGVASLISSRKTSRTASVASRKPAATSTTSHAATAGKSAKSSSSSSRRTSAKPSSSRATSAAAPANATARCTDGTYSSAQTQRGACSGHGGVATWLASAPPMAPASVSNPAPAATAAPGNNTSSQIPTVRAPAGAPAGATALCKDGTYSTSKVHTGACSHHGGVSEWLQ